MMAAINLSDEEQSPDQPPIETEAEGAQPNKDKIEQSDEAGLEQPAETRREQPEGVEEELGAERTGEDGVVKIHHYERIVRWNRRGYGLEGISTHTHNTSKIHI